MNVKRYFGRSNKEAMAKLRAELGDNGVVLRNRAVDGGVEILAMAEDLGIRADALAAEPPAERLAARDAHAGSASEADAIDAEGDSPVPEMSTVSFQKYVRDRLAQKLTRSATLDEVVRAATSTVAPAPEDRRPMTGFVRQPEAAAARPEIAAAMPTAPAATPPARLIQASQARPIEPSRTTQQPFPQAPQQVQAANQRAQSAPMQSARQAAAPAPAARRVEQPLEQGSVLAELRDMRSFIAEQLSSLVWVDGTLRSPLQSRLLRQLLTAGFSPALARAIVTRLPSDYSDAQAELWMRQALAHNLRCDAGHGLLDQGGIFALVGPTGVGKTTSAAKIAARFVLQHGAQSVGLITVDAYRIGAKDQLRTYGKMLGVPVHVAHDAATLADFLHLFQSKKLVLIDTAGVGQRDERVEDLLASLSSTAVSKLLVLNAASQSETLEDVIVAYRASTAAGVVISKVDEAVKLGGVIDCAIRHKLQLVGVADGQRVPEDWQPPCAEALVESAFAVSTKPVFNFDERELGLMFMGGAQQAAAPARGSHA